MVSPLPTIPTRPRQLARAVSALLVDGCRQAVAVTRAVAFWLAIMLPVAVVTVLVAGGAGERPLLVGVLLAASVLCTLVGHGHSPA